MASWCFSKKKQGNGLITGTSSLSLFVFSLLVVSPTKEIKIVSAVRRSSMSSCGSSGYFSSSPTLSSSPPVLCNPKSGEHQHGLQQPGCGHLFGRRRCEECQSSHLSLCFQEYIKNSQCHRFLGQRELLSSSSLKSCWTQARCLPPVISASSP